MTVRRILVGVGTLGVLVGVAFALRPALATSISMPRDALVLVGLLALVEGLRSVRSRRAVHRRAPPLPEVEERSTTPVPGDDLRDRIAWLAAQPGPRRGGTPRDVRTRLRSAAIGAIARRDGIDRHEATRRVDQGTWTDDPFAAAFLGDDVAAPPLTARLRVAVSREARIRHDAERTATAIVSIREGE